MLVQVLFETEQQTEQLDLININRNVQISTHRYNKTISRAVEIVIRKCFLTSNIYTLRLLHRHINVKTKLCNFMVFGSSRPLRVSFARPVWFAARFRPLLHHPCTIDILPWLHLRGFAPTVCLWWADSWSDTSSYCHPLDAVAACESDVPDSFL